MHVGCIYVCIYSLCDAYVGKWDDKIWNEACTNHWNIYSNGISGCQYECRKQLKRHLDKTS